MYQRFRIRHAKMKRTILTNEIVSRISYRLFAVRSRCSVSGVPAIIGHASRRPLGFYGSNLNLQVYRVAEIVRFPAKWKRFAVKIRRPTPTLGYNGQPRPLPQAGGRGVAF